MIHVEGFCNYRPSKFSYIPARGPIVAFLAAASG
jgi:hypothetical protein